MNLFQSRALFRHGSIAKLFFSLGIVSMLLSLALPGLTPEPFVAHAQVTVSAGQDQTLTLPTSETTLQGSASNGTNNAVAYLWINVSTAGPTGIPPATIVSPTAATTRVTGLIQGTYIFQLQATVNNTTGQPETGTDTVTVTVNTSQTTGSGSSTSINLDNDINYNQFKPSCSATGFLSGGEFLGCISHIVYFIFYKIPAIFAGLMGKIFDFFVGFSIDSGSYSDRDGSSTGIGSTIQKAWQTTRDIANIFFIVLLLYTAIGTIFNIGSINYKTLVPTIIMNALLINFSLFFTKAMIDISNIGAHIFYNQIVVENPFTKTRQEGTGGYTPISEGIVAGFQPQRIMSSAFGYLTDSSVAYTVLKSLHDRMQSADMAIQQTAIDEYNEMKIGARDDAYDFTGLFRIRNKTLMPDVEEFRNPDFDIRALAQKLIANREEITENTTETSSYAGKFIIVSILAGAIAFTTGLLFFRIAFIFLGRVVGLYVAMIFSPFAFLSRNIPFAKGIAAIGWAAWLKNMTQYMIIGPLFIFFLYIIHKLLSSSFYQENVVVPGAGFISTVIQVCIPMLIIYTLLLEAKKLAQKYGGEFTDKLFGWGQKVAGLGVGLASGGVAMAGTRGLAWLGRTAQRGRLGAMAEAGKTSRNWFTKTAARGTSSALNWTQKTSWDPRNTMGLKTLTEKAGFDTKFADKNLSYVGLSTKDFKGGFEARKKKLKDDRKKEYESIKANTSKETAQKFWENKLVKKFEREYKKDLKKRGFTGEDLKKKLASSDSDYVEQYNKFKEDADKKYGEVKDAKTLTKALKRQYVENLEKGKTKLETAGDTLAGGAIGGYAGNTFAQVGTAVGVPLSQVGLGLSGAGAGAALAFEQTRMQRLADKDFIDEIKKTRKKEEKAEEKLEKIKSTLEQILKHAQDMDNEILKNYPKGTKFDDLHYEQQEEVIAARRSHLEAEFELKSDLADALKAKYNADKTNEAAKKAYFEAAKQKSKAKNDLDEMKDILEKRDKAEENLQKVKDGGDKDKGKKEEKKEEDKEKK